MRVWCDKSNGRPVWMSAQVGALERSKEMVAASGRARLRSYCRVLSGFSCTAFEITGCRGPPIDSLRFSIRCGSDAPQMFVGSKDAPRVPCRRLPLAFASISASALDPAPSGPATDTSEPLLQSALQLWLQVRSRCHACQTASGMARSHEAGIRWAPCSHHMEASVAEKVGSPAYLPRFWHVFPNRGNWPGSPC